MAILSKQEYRDRLNSIITGDTDDDLKNIEDLIETYDDLESKTADSGNWEQKYKDNDEMWRKKYRDRFFEAIDETEVTEVDTPPENESDIEEETEVTEFEDLFEEKGENE